MKIKFGAMVVAGSGKLGGHVFARNRAGAYVRTKVTPLNPQSLRQTKVRELFASISSTWSTMTEQQRQSYVDKVQEYARTNVFGDIKNPSAKSLHQRLNQNLLNTGQSAQTVCPSSELVPAVGLTFAEYDLGAGTFTLTLSGNTAGNKLIVFATPSMSQGTRFVKNKMKQIGTYDGVDNASILVQDQYNSIFGIPEVDANVHVKVVVINTNGQASPGVTIKSTILII